MHKTDVSAEELITTGYSIVCFCTLSFLQLYSHEKEEKLSTTSNPILDWDIPLAVAKERAHQKRTSKRAPQMDWSKKNELFSNLWSNSTLKQGGDVRAILENLASPYASPSHSPKHSCPLDTFLCPSSLPLPLLGNVDLVLPWATWKGKHRAWLFCRTILEKQLLFKEDDETFSHTLYINSLS